MSDLDRRTFFRLLASTAAAAVLPPIPLPTYQTGLVTCRNWVYYYRFSQIDLREFASEVKLIKEGK